MCFRCPRTWTCCNGYFEAICEELTAMFACVLIISLPFQHIFPIHDPLIISRRIATRKDATTPVKKQQALFYSLYFFSFSYFTAFSLFLIFSALAFNCSIKRSNILHFIFFLKAPPIMRLASTFYWLRAMKDIYSVHYTVTYITLKKPCV